MKWYRFATLIWLAGLGGCAEGAGPADFDPASAPTPAAEEIPSTLQLQKSWVGKKPMPTARKNLVAVSVNGMVYAIGGEGGNSKVQAYDPATDAWTQRASLPDGRTAISGAVAISGKIYVPGGSDGNWPTKTLFVYNPAANNWSPKADLPGPSLAGASVAINGKLYVYTPGIVTDDGWPRLYRYDPVSDKWVKLARPPHSVQFPAAGAIGGKLYLAGGLALGGVSDKLDVYDPVTNSWALKEPMPGKRYHAAGAVASNGLLLTQRLYVIGGASASGWSSSPLNSVVAYNPATNTWTTVPPLRIARRGLAAVTAKGIIYAMGGATSTSLLASNEAY